MNTTQNVTPLRDGSFPRVMLNGLISLSLGNGSRFDVCLTPTEQGLLVAVVRHGAYFFAFAPDAGYLGGKLKLMDGDAEPMARFVAAQMD